MANQLGTIMAGAELAAGPTPGNAGDVTAVTGTSPIVVTSGTGPVPNVTIIAATTGAAGSMSAADKTKLDGFSVIGDSTVSGQTSFTTASWTANRFWKVTLEFVGTVSGGTPVFGFMNVLMNVDSGTNYGSTAVLNNGGVLASQPRVVGTATSIDLCESNNNNTSQVSISLELFPITNGNPRIGSVRGFCFNTATQGIQLINNFMWNNTATNITFLTVGITDGVFSGRFVVRGYE